MNREIHSVTGLNRLLFDIKLRFNGLKYILNRFIKSETNIFGIYKFLKRSVLFSKVTKTNKYISINGKTKIDVYLPGLGTKAYIKALDKLATTKGPMPCSSALISVTSACRNRCDFCYQKLDKGGDLEIEYLLQSVDYLKNHGVSFFTVQGGDPFLRYDRLKKVVTQIGDGAEIWINSTGDGMDYLKLEELKKLGVSTVVFSLHSLNPDEFNHFFNNPNAWNNLVAGIGLCHKLGIAVAFNVTLFKPDFYNGKFEAVMDKALDLGACYVQIIKPKPSGEWLSKEIDDFVHEDFIYIKRLIHKYNHNSKYKKYPSIWAQMINEHKDVFGCIAGGIERVYLNSKGDVQPCEFLNLSFGNVKETSMEIIFKRMHKHFSEPHTAWLCETCAKDIHCEYKKTSDASLPLNYETSKRLLDSFDMGEKTKFYQKIK